MPWARNQLPPAIKERHVWFRHATEITNHQNPFGLSYHHNSINSRLHFIRVSDIVSHFAADPGNFIFPPKAGKRADGS